jgi:predicted transcriptional regulator
MTIRQLVELVEGRVVCGDTDYDQAVVERAFASDLMSDVLTLDTEKLLLITGLTNLQTIRTAEMSDINAILFVRNKKISPEILKLAEENKMTLIESPWSMYRVCGVLFSAGLKPAY